MVYEGGDGSGSVAGAVASLVPSGPTTVRRRRPKIVCWLSASLIARARVRLLPSSIDLKTLLGEQPPWPGLRTYRLRPP